MTLPLVPNQPFASGDPFTPDLAYLAFNAPIFDGQTQYLGHRAPLTDAELDGAATSLKGRVAAITDALKPSVVSGLTVAYQAGIVALQDGSTLSISAAQVAVPDNSTSYLYLDQAGAVQVGSTPTVTRRLIAKVVSSGGAISTLTDLRDASYRRLEPIVSAIKIFGGTSTTDETATAGKVYDQGVYYFRNFTVPAGITVTVKGWARFYCSGNVSIQGTVNVSQVAAGATGFATPFTSANTGGLPGTGIGTGSGSQNTPTPYYGFAAQPYGSGGGLGLASGSSGAGVIGNAGSGGGGIWIEAAGTINVGNSGSISAKGSDAVASTVTSGTGSVSGSGAGSGGLVYLASLVSVTTVAGSTIDVRGGNGGAAANTTGSNTIQGGGGGGGGYIVFAAPTVSNAGTTLLSGGSNGANAGSGGTTVGGGVGGSFGGTGGTSGVSSTTGQQKIFNFVPLGS